MVKILQFFIRIYSFLVSPWLGRNCRFSPTCSCYAQQALDKHGFFKGVFLAIRRILSCQPWSKKKWDDPVPERFAWSDILGYKR
ncbi:MAG: membrane protein insertion efficiency factor YidD [Alphaproteobacteria bacterium]